MRNIRTLRIFEDSSSSGLRLFTLRGGFVCSPADGMYSVIWNRRDTVIIVIDGISTLLRSNQIITLTPSHHFSIPQPVDGLLILQFNEGFYCVERHDKEVSCIGHIFYGSSNIITIALAEPDEKRLSILFEMLAEEFENRDTIQREMLTVLLKRLIIICTRLAKGQHFAPVEGLAQQAQQALVRQFNILVEKHFREERSIQFYAAKLNRSPKTLANVFRRLNVPSPIQVLHNRVLTEARRQLLHSEKSVKEIAHELHFADPQTFGRFWKSKTGFAPTELRRKIAC